MENMNKKLTSPITPLLVLILLLLPLYAGAWIRSPATTFAELPSGATNPEGITVGPDGNVYVGTFAVGGTDSGVGEIFVFRPNGKFLRKIEVQGSSTLLLEIAFHPTTGDFLVLDFGAGKVLKVDPLTGNSVVFTSIPDVTDADGTLGSGPGLNVLTFDNTGNVYISDSFQGIIWQTASNGTGLTEWAKNELLQVFRAPSLSASAVPPFGANGLAFNKAQTALFVANTGNDQIIKIPVNPGPTAGAPEVFVNSINGADGLIIDENDNLWVAANQADEIVVIEPTEGRVIAKLGDFDGLTPKGAPAGLLFPASLVRSGNFIYVTNLALDLRLFGLAPPVDAPWAAEVKIHTVAKIPARIPPVGGFR